MKLSYLLQVYFNKFTQLLTYLVCTHRCCICRQRELPRKAPETETYIRDSLTWRNGRRRSTVPHFRFSGDRTSTLMGCFRTDQSNVLGLYQTFAVDLRPKIDCTNRFLRNLPPFTVYTNLLKKPSPSTFADCTNRFRETLSLMLYQLFSTNRRPVLHLINIPTILHEPSDHTSLYQSFSGKLRPVIVPTTFEEP